MTHKQKKTLTRILITAVLFALLLAMEHTGSFDAWNLSRMQLFILHVIPYLVIGYDVIAKAVKNIRNGQIFDENFLMMIATFAAFAIGEYEEALAVMLFYQTGEWFQSYAVGKSRESIAEMMSIVPEYANRVEADGTVSEEDPEDIAAGDVIIVKPGEKIPLDGEVIEGESWLDTAALTGESVPRRVQTGDSCISGCVNGEGTLRVRVTKAYEDSTVSRILELVENASEKKARLENFITRFARYYTPVVTIGAVLLAVVPPLFFHGPWAEWVKRACVFLIVSCPCALVISVPLGFFGGIGAASGIGVLVKGSNFLEAVSKADTVVFDKTGTLTKGTFAVTALIPAGEAPVPVEQGAATGDAARLLLTYAAYAEAFSNHPVARSIREAYGMEPDLQRLSEATETPGHGVRVLFDQKELLAGSAKLMQEHGVRMRLPGQEETAFSLPAEAANATGTVVCVAYDGMYRGAVAVSDTVKEGAAKALAQMKAAGVTRTVMLTGDRKGAAESVAASCGIDEVHAELLPADKVAAVESYMKNAAEHASAASGRARTVVFVGDGVNDAPVLMRADVGIAMGAIGSDAAIEAADIVLMDDNIVKIAQVIRIARKTLRIVHQNVAFAIGVKFLVLALGALGLAGMWGAVFADVGVAVLAILNSMRMLRYRC